MSKIETLIKEIEEIIQRYLRQSRTATIENLLEWRDKLAGRNYFLGEVLADLKTDYSNSEYWAQIKLEEAKRKLIDGGAAYNDANSRAKVQVQDATTEAMEYKLAFFRYEHKERHIRDILDAMNQRISYLKDEKNRISKGQ